VKAGTGSPALADEHGTVRSGKRCRLLPDHREMPPLGAARQVALAAIGAYELEAVEDLARVTKNAPVRCSL
jgi:hypothetical protein